MIAILRRRRRSVGARARHALAGPARRRRKPRSRSGWCSSIANAANLWAHREGLLQARSASSSRSRTLDTSANTLAILAQNQLQIVEGGISAGYFNGLEKNLPITIVMDRVSSPLGHNLMLRPDLKGQITRLKQLKGKVIATNGHGAVSTYEVGKMLETDGITIADVEVKVMPFPQMAIAIPQQGDRRRDRDPAVHLAVHRRRLRRRSSRTPTTW